MEQIARRALTEQTVALLIQNWAKAPVIFSYWTELFPSAPELVITSFARIIDVFPVSRIYAAYCLSNSIFPLKTDNNQNDTVLIELLICIWRLLRCDRHTFLRHIPPTQIHPLLQHDNCAIKFLAQHVLAYHMDMADDRLNTLTRLAVGDNSIMVSTGLHELIDLRIFPVEEDRRLQATKLALENQITADNIGSDIGQENCLAPCETQYTTQIAGVYLPRFSKDPRYDSRIVLTPTTRSNLFHLANALISSDAILLQGHSGSGKTFLIEDLAKCLGRSSDLLRIHLGDQTDAKLLLGTYVTSALPGQFTWQPGILTTAVKQGCWLLVEDIDKAPSDVLSILLPLLEHKRISIPSRDEVIEAGPTFKVIATKTTTAHAPWSVGNMLGGRLWKSIEIDMLSDSELREVIESKYPTLVALSQQIISTYRAMSDVIGGSEFKKLVRKTSARNVGTMDLMKWCHRIETISTANGILSPSDAITQRISDDIFSEAVDCFAAAMPSESSRRFVVETLGRCLQVPPEKVTLYLDTHTPQYSDAQTFLQVGRASLSKMITKRHKRGRPFAMTGHATCLLEQLVVCTKLGEPVLLVGETGTGKTTVVQHLADSIGQNLVAINMSQQTESGDLIGGYKPIDTKSLAIPLLEAFEALFQRTLSAVKNAKFLAEIRKCFNRAQWSRFLKLLQESIKIAHKKLNQNDNNYNAADMDSSRKRRRHNDDLRKAWQKFSETLVAFEAQQANGAKSFTFSFVEGALVRAVRNGDWVLLDEINLAAADTLESINGLLQDEASILLAERGDMNPIIPHKNFRLFACMNPATDVGKRDLPPGIRARFTEFYVDSPDNRMADLLAIIQKYIGGLCLEDDKACMDVAHLYLETKRLAAENRLVDGANHQPHYSIRTLSRTLSYVADITHIYGLRRSLYEGFCMSFLTLLDVKSEQLLRPLIEEYTVLRVRNARALISQIPKRPIGGEFVQFRHFWVPKGPEVVQDDPRYIITPYVEKNLLNLVRAAATRKYPILLQGPTSSGKTSMVEHLAKRTGHRFVRINNHEHTDLQEYLGTYLSDDNGNLVFQEGILVQALRTGSWLVLDELNLAPSDVLEALNRLLDDNREILIPETQEVIKPHPSFVLFATQNPAGLYGGRKHLSRAFRNRFLELHFDDIPEDELETILCQRCQVAPSYCKRIVEVYKQLTMRRQSSRIFESKNSFATLRDLFRWATRPAVGYDELAINGYLLLAERVRRTEEQTIVREVIEQVMKVSLQAVLEYDIADLEEYKLLVATGLSEQLVWTRSMRRLFILVALAFRNNEPVLLVGETGCGKTSVCQALAHALSRPMQTLNAHQNTETADIIGSQRPIRNKDESKTQLADDLRVLLNACNRSMDDNTEIEALVDAFESIQLEQLILSQPELVPDHANLKHRVAKAKALFEWADGPLVQAMKKGEIFLLDEISLAEDAVLERLNSVLETGRTLMLAEKGTEDSSVKASPEYQFCATMNPGGDYGKKELSPALRNRFTEIWVPAMSDDMDVLEILSYSLSKDRVAYAGSMLEFAKFFSQEFQTALTSSTVSIRDLLSWCQFCNLPLSSSKEAFIHGAALVYIDALGANLLGNYASETVALAERRGKCLTKLSELAGFDCASLYFASYQLRTFENHVAIGPFSIEKGTQPTQLASFHLEAPTTFLNAKRVFRAMQLTKPILLEGSPGVGKTSLISAIASLACKTLVRINFSDQTDLADLFGSDSPVEASAGINFVWRDAPFLQAMQNGNWVLLDEMNLASQSILEGLNACLDHRGQAYIPELNRTFTRHPDFRVFAAQNPHSQGGGRKGLPKSFVNRFTVVYCDPLDGVDILQVCTKIMPQIPSQFAEEIVEFIGAVQKQILLDRDFGTSGGPWEFNLRDILRWIQLISDGMEVNHVAYYADTIIRQRFRTPWDRQVVDKLVLSHFDDSALFRPGYAELTTLSLTLGRTTVARDLVAQMTTEPYLGLLNVHISAAESVLLSIKAAWPCILAGESGVGKSRMISDLALLLGGSLQIIAMNNDMDASDILGSYEQKDIQRSVSQQYGQVIKYLKAWLRDHCLDSHAIVVFKHLEQLFVAESLQEMIPNSIQVLELLATSEAADFGHELAQLERDLSEASLGHFQWTDGSLLRAIKNGQWVVLDNANLCNPSVLDRLNSLLEPGGHLIVNERIMPDGRPMTVKPHRNFRLFLTVDPRHGELSRAMRNRCVEIFLPKADIADASACVLRHTSAEQSFWSAFSSSLSSITSSGQDSTQDVVDLYAQSLIGHMPTGLLPRALSKCDVSQSSTTELIFRSRDAFNLDPSFQTLLRHDSISYLNPRHLEGPVHVKNELWLQAAKIELVVLLTGLESRSRTFFEQMAAVSTDFASTARILAEFLSALGRRITSPDELFTSFEADVCKAITELFAYVVSARSSSITFEICFAMMRKLRDTLESGAARMSASEDFMKIIKRSRLTDKLKTGFLMVRLWLISHPQRPANAEAHDAYLKLEQSLNDLDNFVFHNNKSIEHSVPVQLAFLETLRDSCRVSAQVVQAAPPSLKQHIPDVGIRHSERRIVPLFRQLLVLLQIQQMTQFSRWAAVQNPVLQDLLRLNSLAELPTCTLLDFLLPNQDYATSKTRRFSALNTTVLENVQTLEKLHKDESSGDATSRFIEDWQNIIRDISELQLGNTDTVLSDLQEVGHQANMHSEAVLATSPVSMTKILLLKLHMLVDELCDSTDSLPGFDNTAEPLEDRCKLLRIKLRSLAPLCSTAINAQLLHCVDHIQDSTTNSGDSSQRQSAGRAWICYCKAFLLMYIPSVPLDPAAEVIFERDLAVWKYNRASERTRIQALVTSKFFGSESDVQTPQLMKTLEQALQERDSATEINVYRPTKSLIYQLQAEYDYCISLVSEGSVIDQVLTQGYDNMGALVPQILSLDTSLQKLGERLESFKGYSDVVAPITETLLGLRYGLQLLANDQTGNLNDAHITRSIFKDPTNPLALIEWNLATEKDLEEIDSSDCNIHQVVLAKLIHMLYQLNNEGLTDSHNFVLGKLMRKVFQNWYIQRAESQEKATQDASIFKYSDTALSSSEDFSDIFPDYEDVSLTNSAAIRARADTSLEAEIFDMFTKLLTSGHDLSDPNKALTLLEAVTRLQQVLSPKPIISQPALAAASYTAYCEITAMDMQKPMDHNVPYNFYKSPNVLEIRRVIPVLHSLRTRIAALALLWPENSVLIEINEATQRLLQCSIKASLAQVLTMLEQIFDLLAQWQDVASREHAVTQILGQIREQIISWRKFELSCWPHLFDIEETATKNADSKIWYNMYEMMVFAREQQGDVLSTDFLQQSVILLLEFMKAASLGQFDQRLQYLRAFSQYVSTQDKSGLYHTEYSDAICHLTSYFTAFAPLVREHQARERKVLVKEVTQIIQLASWKDTNVFALRESARRSHRTLYKIVHKYRRILNSPVDGILQKGLLGLPEVKKDQKISLVGVSFNTEKAGDVYSTYSAQQSSERPARYRFIGRTTSKIRSIIATGDVLDLRNYLQEFVDETIESMQELRAETPTVYDKAQNALVSHLKNRKYKLMSDAFKTLKLLGLRSVIKADDLQRQKSLETLFLTTTCLAPTGDFAKLNNYFYRIADILPQIRSSYANHSEDVTAHDIRRASGYFDDLFLHLLQERGALKRFNTHLNSLEAEFSLFESICIKEGYDSSFSFISAATIPDHVAKIAHAKQLLATLQQLLMVTEAYHIAHLAFMQRGVSLASQHWWETIHNDCDKLHTKFCNIDGYLLPTSLVSGYLNDLSEFIAQVKGRIRDYQVETSSSAFVFDQVRTWLDGQSVRPDSSHDTLGYSHSSDLSQLESMLQTFCDKILLATQKINLQHTASAKIDSENAWYAASTLQRKKNLRSASIESLLPTIQQIKQHIISISTNDAQKSMHLQAICTHYAPVLHTFILLCHALLKDFSNFHTNTSRCTLLVGQTLVSLSTNGFCSPTPPDNDADQGTATADGTGLGQGTGTDDITKDLEDDEDLGDLEGIEDTNDKGDQDEGDQAKEMEDDVGGDLEDVDKQSGSEEEDENSDQEDLDEEIGNVDDEDETALDEKMWDDKQDDLRDKNTEKKDQGQTENDAATDLVDKEDEGDSAEIPPEDRPSKEENTNVEDEVPSEDEAGEEEAKSPETEDHTTENHMEAADNLDLPDDLNMEDASEDEDSPDDQDKSDAEAEPEPEPDPAAESGDEEIEENALDKAAGLPDDEVRKEDEPIPEEDIANHEDANEENGSDEESQTEQVLPENDKIDETQDTQEENQNSDGRGQDEGGEDANIKQGEEDHDMLDKADEEMDDKDFNEAPTGSGSDANGADNAVQTGEASLPSDNPALEDLRSLGDALKEYRRMLDIQTATKDVQEKAEGVKEGQDINQFEHIGEDTEMDGQVMGPNHEQAQEQSKETGDDVLPEDGALPELENNKIEGDSPEAKSPGSEINDAPAGAGLLRPDMDLDPQVGDRTAQDEAMVDSSSDEDDETSMKDEVEVLVANEDDDLRNAAARMWHSHERGTRDLANGLCEQLRLILEPTMATKMRGDFKTGKRLNMRRIIPYIASQFKKDKIWMRRSKPSKRQYQVMLAIDDSKSMAESSSVTLAFDTVALVATALSVLEVGQMSVVKFGAVPELVHNFQDQFSSEAGAKIFESFSFNQSKTDVRALTHYSLDLFRDARAMQHSSAAELWQLQFIISDGLCEDHDSIRRILRQAQEERIMVIFLVIDTIHAARKHSILQMSQVKYVTSSTGGKKLEIQQYMNEFAFEHFLIIQDVAELPELLCSTLRQFFAASQ